MLFRSSILSTCLILGLGCSKDDEHKQGTFEQPQAPVAESPISPATSLLQHEEESIDYKAKYTISPPKDDRWMVFPPFQSPRPPSWFWVPPKSTVVTCNYTVPGIDGGGLAIFSITQFEYGEGGSLSANVQRWNALFNTHEGGPVKPTIETVTINGHNAAIVTLRGEYMGVGAAWHKPDQTLLIMVTEDQNGTTFFKLLGPTTTVEAHRAEFITILEGMETVLPSS